MPNRIARTPRRATTHQLSASTAFFALASSGLRDWGQAIIIPRQFIRAFTGGMCVTVLAGRNGSVDDRQHWRDLWDFRCPTSDADSVPQLRIELGAKGGDDLSRLLSGESTEQKRLIGERETGREIFGENDGRPGRDERRDVPIVGGADHARNGCLPLARELQDPLDGGVAVESDDDQPSLCEAGGGQDPAMRGIAVHNRVALSLCLLETGEVRLDGDVRYFRRVQRGRDKTSDPSASAQQDGTVQ